MYMIHATCINNDAGLDWTEMDSCTVTLTLSRAPYPWALEGREEGSLVESVCSGPFLD